MPIFAKGFKSVSCSRLARQVWFQDRASLKSLDKGTGTAHKELQNASRFTNVLRQLNMQYELEMPVFARAVIESVSYSPLARQVSDGLSSMGIPFFN